MVHGRRWTEEETKDLLMAICEIDCVENAHRAVDMVQLRLAELRSPHQQSPRSKNAIYFKIYHLASLAGLKTVDYMVYIREEAEGEKLLFDSAVEQQYGHQSCSPTMSEASEYLNEHVVSEQTVANVATPPDSTSRTVGIMEIQEHQDIGIILEPYEHSLILTIRSFLRDKGYEPEAALLPLT
jgi:hypothetical protein